MNTLPPFPVDDTTLALLMDAIEPPAHEQAESSSLWPLLDMLSSMAGSDVEAVAEQVDEQTAVMRDPVYTDRCVIRALIVEVRRLRAAACG